MSHVAAVVVTYNRRKLLGECLQALRVQSTPLDRIIVIDNASTDDTSSWMKTSGLDRDERISYVRLSENGGGAGGFAEGISQAMTSASNWFWLMDDDALPTRDALECLMAAQPAAQNVYASVAVNGADTSWTMSPLDAPGTLIDKVDELPKSTARVLFVPFLGFLIHRSLVQEIGLPDAGFFIAADDVEYCLRARGAGAEVIMVCTSHITHPKADRYRVRLGGHTFTFLRLTPWKRYYDTRNRLLIARRHYGLKMLTQTIPGSLIRMLAALVHEPRRSAQLWAFTAGFVDGLLGRKGRRHERWHIAV